MSKPIIPTTTPWERCNAKVVRAKAWSSLGITNELAHVDRNGNVYLFDECASHWTMRHSLSAKAIRRIATMPL